MPDIPRPSSVEPLRIRAADLASEVHDFPFVGEGLGFSLLTWYLLESRGGLVHPAIWVY